MNTLTTPEQASAVILLRSAPSKGFEVFLTRRPESAPLLAGTYGCPAQVVTKEDFSDTMMARCSGITPEQTRKILGTQFSPKKAVGLWIAAIRGLFEELGILLAVEEPGTRLTPAQAAALADHNQVTFLSLLESENLRGDLSRLAHFSHWQTPTPTSARMDIHFFLAVIPADQRVRARLGQMASSLWLTPDHALQLFDRGELPLAFSTFSSLRKLADFDSLDSVLTEYFRNRASA